MYANNAQFELSSWDLKIIFGELNQSGGKTTVEQHTAVTVSWVQAKLFAYYLQVNIAFYELQHGKIAIPKETLPPEPPPIPEELANDPQAKAANQLFKKMRGEFLSTL